MVEAAQKIFKAKTPSFNDYNDDISTDNELTSSKVLEQMANDLFYRFNFTVTSHGHREEGFRNGRKDGEFNAKFREGVDTHVRYVSNEFGYQPNITLVARQETNESNDSDAKAPEPFEGPQFFRWFRK